MNFKLNNKGFTLVELLAVIVILVTVSLVAVGGISNSLQNRDVKECVEQQELAVSAAKMYFSLDGTNTNEVLVFVLKDKGYFTNGKKIDELDLNDKITFSDSGYLYNGKKAGESCGE